jgi:transcriptional regulator with PAS, ATPase and Fis domain
MGKRQVPLTLYASDKVIHDFLEHWLYLIFGDDIRLTSYSTKTMTQPVYGIPVVLTSHPSLADQAHVLFPGSVIIPGHKTVSGLNLEKLFQLPRGKRVLVGILSNVMAREVAHSLEALGIDHLELIPHSEQYLADDPVLQDIDTAVTPGMPHMVPKFIPNIIDIGPRVFSPSVMIELIRILGLDWRYMTVYFDQYNRVLMGNARKLSGHLERSEALLRQHKIVLNKTENGIVVYDGDGNVTLLNRSMLGMFGLWGRLWCNMPIAGVLHNIGARDAGAPPPSSPQVIFSFNGRDYNCSQTPNDPAGNGGFYFFNEVSKIMELEGEVRRRLYQKGYVAKYDFDSIWGTDARLLHAKEIARQFAFTDQTILITGESGTGKELFAQAIHLNSQRKKGPFLAMNFAAIPDALVESELFGYEGGAFTGAKKDGHIGVFEQTHGGTLFLDEIGDASLSIQAKLLRVLQEKEIMRVGGDKIIPVSIRIVAATNKSLSRMVGEGQFRADLFYRLNVLPIELPALREHAYDILPMFEKKLLLTYGAKKRLSVGAQDILTRYTWPGNIRELFNIVDYVYYVSNGRELIDVQDIPHYIREQSHEEPPPDGGAPESRRQAAPGGPITTSLQVLEALAAMGCENIGRGRLIGHLNQRGVGMTEHRLRRILYQLEKEGYLSIGQTKQGSTMTEAGIRYLRSQTGGSGEPSE